MEIKNNMKLYNFLNEFIDPASAYVIGKTALGAYALANTGYNTIKNAKQNSFNTKYTNLMYNELSRCDSTDRAKASAIVDKYSRLITQMYTNVNKGMSKKLSNMQYFININFRTPLLKIINNTQDMNWKTNCLVYLKNNSNKIKWKNRANTALTGVGVAAGSALMGGVGGNVVAGISTGVFFTKVAINQLKVFNGTKYINKMIAELKQCNDNDRNTALNIVQKYCYDISNTIEGLVNKTGKKIPFNIQSKMRNQFLMPLRNIIFNEKSIYWKVQLIDYIETQKLQEFISNICNSIITLIIPRVVKR